MAVMTKQSVKNKPTLSVTTPVYNGADLIFRCYENLLQQTFTNWEWVVVDDGSTDGTAEIVRGIDDSRVRLLSYRKNKGRGHARNLAIKESRGDWIVVWDVDDIHFPERLKIIEEARLKNYDYFCSYAVVANNRTMIKGVRGFLRASGCLPKSFVHPTLALRKNLAEEIGYVITKGVGGIGEDARMIWTLSLKYQGLWHEDALTVYHEETEINLIKGIDCNRAHLQTIKEMKRTNTICFDSKYIYTIIKYYFKLLILKSFKFYPKIYNNLVRFRDYGIIKEGYMLSQDKMDFIERYKMSS